MKLAKESMRSFSTTKLDKASKGFSCSKTFKKRCKWKSYIWIENQVILCGILSRFQPHKEPQNNVGGGFGVFIYLCGAC